MSNTRLRGNTFIVLLLRASTNVLGSSPGWGKNNNGVTAPNLFADLLRLTKPDYTPAKPNSLSTYFSAYLQGKRPFSDRYFPFDKLDFQCGLQMRIKNDYHAVLTQMNEFCNKYLNMSDLALRQLVGGLVDAILDDETFNGSFDVGGRWVDKEELDDICEFTLQPFLVSVWSTILSDYPDAAEGADTYSDWTREAGGKSPRYIRTPIGTDRAKRIKVNVEISESIGEAPLENSEQNLDEKKGPAEKKAEPKAVEAEIVDDVPHLEKKTITKDGRTYNQTATTIINIESLETLYV